MPASKNTPAVRDVELSPAGLIPTSVLAEAIQSGTKLHVALDNEQIAAAMLARKLNATTVEELGSSAELDKIETVYGRPVRIMGVGFRNSDESLDSPLGIYVVLNLVTAEGENITTSTGALDVLVTAAKVAELDQLGKHWWVIAPAAKKTGAGFTPLNITLAAQDSAGEPF